MAGVKRSLVTAQGPGSTNFTVELPQHTTNDLILIPIANDGGGTAIGAPAGWSLIGTQAASGASRTVAAYKVAASSAEANPVFTGANDDFVGAAIIIEGADTPTPIHGAARADYTGTTTSQSPALTTTNPNCLILNVWGTDGGPGMRVPLGDLSFVDQGYSGTAVGLVVGWQNQEVAGAVPQVTMTRSASTNGGNAWTIAINNATDGGMRGRAVEVCSDVRVYGTGFETGTYTAPNAVTGLTDIDGQTSFDTTVGVADSAIYSTSVTSVLNGNSWVGGFDTFAAKDLSGAILSVRWTAPGVITGRVASRGFVVVAVDSANNWKAFTLAQSKYNQLVAANNYVSFFDLDDGVALDSAGAINTADIVKVGWLYERAAGGTSVATFAINPLFKHGVLQVVGGNVATPLTPADIDFSSAEGPSISQLGWGLRDICSVQGTQQLILPVSCQFGNGGTTETHVNLSDSSIETPPGYADNYLWNVADNKINIVIYAGANDVMDFSSGVLKANTPQLITVHASSSLLAEYNFNGRAFIGFTYTDNAGLTYDGATWKDGKTATFKNAAALTNCTISETTAGATEAAMAVTHSGIVVTSSTIDLTGTSAGYHLELGAAVTAITLTDVTFTGTPGTDKVHVLATTGTVTITISGTTNLATDGSEVTSAGATVVIAAPTPTLDATVLNGSRVVLYNNTTAAELDNTAPAGTSWSKQITSGASAGDSLTLHVFKEGYEEFSTTVLYSGADATLLVTQVAHAAIQSLRTELSITDYTTITEFALDITGTVEIDADDADGSTQKARFAIWYNGVLTTENGARYLRGALTILSTAAFRINTAILDLKFENVSVTFGLNFTDTERRLYRDDGAPIYAAASAPGSIQNDYSGVPDTVETGVSGLTGSESAQLMGLTNAPSAATVSAQILADAATTPIAANIKQVNSLAVDGAGTESDPWGPT